MTTITIGDSVIDAIERLKLKKKEDNYYLGVCPNCREHLLVGQSEADSLDLVDSDGLECPNCGDYINPFDWQM